HREVNSIRRDSLRERILARHERLDRGIVREHRDYDAPRMRDVAGALGAARAPGNERLSLRRGAVINRQMESRGEQVRRHRQTHRAQSDESDFLCHRLSLPLRSNVAMNSIATAPARSFDDCCGWG